MALREFGGRRWQTHPQLPDSVAALCAEDPHTLAARGGARIIGDKRLRRTVLVPVDGGLVLVKEIRPPAALRSLVWRVRAHPGQREWRWACRFAAAGLSVPRPWAFFDGGVRGSSWFLQEGVPDVTDLLSYCGARFHTPGEGDALWRAVATRLGTMLATVHNVGANHPDLHPGNILCRGDTVDTLRISLVDYHSIRHGVGPAAGYRAANLARLYWHMEGVLGPARLRDVLAVYLAHVRQPNWQSAEELATCLAARVPRLRLKRARSRAKKAFANSSGFRVVRDGGLRMWHAAETTPEAIREVLARVNSGAVAAHKARPGSALYPVSDALGGQVWVKSYAHAGPWKQVEAWLGRTYSRRGWYALERLRWLAIAAPVGLACVEEWRGLRLVRSHLITRHVEHVADLDTLLFTASRIHGDPDRLRRKRRLIGDLARLVRALHDTGTYHRDLSAKNILVGWWGHDLKFWLVDADSIRFPWFGVRRRARARNLAQLTGLPSTITFRDRLRFLRAYCGSPAGMRAALRDAPLIMRYGGKTQDQWRLREEQAAAGDGPGPHRGVPSLLVRKAAAVVPASASPPADPGRLPDG